MLLNFDNVLAAVGSVHKRGYEGCRSLAGCDGCWYSDFIGRRARAL